ncbi:EAL domain-containing protein, partial [Bacillus subtilis]|uniref:EAL domain-containing protein n=1 Tax=Bacillus subtilis TaxID=1423 RepID=UPI001267D049
AVFAGDCRRCGKCSEGVENAAQKQLLFEKGCDHLQGFFFSRPIPPEQFEQFIIEQPSQ